MAATKIYCNVEDHRLFDKSGGATDKVLIEDVTKVGLPTIKHTITNIKSAGMAMDIDMPNETHLEAMDFTIYHNNGVDCKRLANPGKHNIEFRIARQRYDIAGAVIGHESVKYIIEGAHAESQKGDIETGSPYGTTEKYSIIKYTEIVNGETTVDIDATAHKITINGSEYYDSIEKLLS